MTTLKERQDTLRGLQCWNIQDPAFIGVVILKSELPVHEVMRSIEKLKLGPVQLINWAFRLIRYSSGAEIRVRAVGDTYDARKHLGQEYWAICFLDRIPDDAFYVMKSRVRVPHTHEARKPGVRSRFQDAIDADSRTREVGRGATFPSMGVYGMDWGTFVPPVATPCSVAPKAVPGVLPPGWLTGTSERLKQDDRERALPDTPVKTPIVKITHETADGLLLWTDDKGNVCVVPREQINATYKRKPPTKWDEHVNFFLAMTACQLGETQAKIQAQLDDCADQDQIDTLDDRVDVCVTANNTIVDRVNQLVTITSKLAERVFTLESQNTTLRNTLKTLA